jgi:hypothetical protein
MIRKTAIASLCLAAVPFAADALLNGGFEAGLSGWNSWGADTTSVHHGGAKGCVVRSAKPVWAGLDQKLAIPNGTRTVRVSGWLRADSLRSGKKNWERGRIGVEFTAKGDTVGGFPPAVGQMRGQLPWTHVERSYAVPEGADTIKVQCALGNSSGTLYCDDLSVEFAK